MIFGDGLVREDGILEKEVVGIAWWGSEHDDD